MSIAIGSVATSRTNQHETPWEKLQDLFSRTASSDVSWRLTTKAAENEETFEMPPGFVSEYSIAQDIRYAQHILEQAVENDPAVEETDDTDQPSRSLVSHRNMSHFYYARADLTALIAQERKDLRQVQGQILNIYRNIKLLALIGCERKKTALVVASSWMAWEQGRPCRF